MAGCVPGDGSDCVRARGDGGDGLCGLGGQSPTLKLKILLIGNGSADVTTAAWEAALKSEGVAYDEVTATGTSPSQTVTLPTLSSGTTGNYNGVVIADSPTEFAPGALSALDTYESTFGVRQVDGYMYPDPALGVTEASGGALDGTTGTLTSAGLAAFPELKGPVPFDTGSYGYAGTVNAGAPYTPFLTNSAGAAMAGVYQHPSTDPQAGVAELALNFDYNASQLQWLLLAPGLINWVTNNTHLGLYRNYFGQDIDDVFIADNEWSSQFQCTPAATDPPDYNCPVADQGVAPGSAAGVPADVLMSPADVTYVTNWEKTSGIRLNLLFNAVGACSADTAADESSAICNGSTTDGSTTYTDPGQSVAAGNTNAGALVNALLANQSSFYWETHTWSHLFLGCTVWQPQTLTSATANGTGGTFTAGGYSYEVTAATAYGESEPSAARSVTVGANGSVTLSWPEATNGTGTAGNAGPTLAQEEASHTGGTGFWGYNVYRENPGSTTYGLVGQVPENTAATASTTYSFTDTGTAPGAAPDSGPLFPTATNPGIDCSSGAGSWLPATSTTADSSIEQEIGLDQAFAKANGLTNYTPAAVVTGEHSGVENPNMATALTATGITTIGSDASRQPQQYTIGSALTAPRYPSNIYYNASNFPDQLNEYNSLYVAQGDSVGSTQFPSETGRCVNTSATTCRATPATEADFLASESHIMLSHVLNNDPRVGYAHQSDLIGPATDGSGQDYGYTILRLIDSMLSQYNTWYASTAPITQMNDVTDAQVMAQQAAWATASTAGQVSASETNGVVTVTNNGSGVNVPVTVPAATTVNGAAFGQAYGGELSDWVNLGTGATETLTESVAPAITSAASASSIVGAPFSFTVATTGAPAPALTETGALPAGITFTDNGNGTATIAGTAAAGSGGSFPIQITAANSVGGVTQSFTLTNSEAPSITSANTATFSTGVAGTYTVTTTGYPAAALTESGTLPSGLTFTDNKNGTATITGTAGTAGSYPVTISATNSSGSTATLALTITVNTAAAPTITSGSVADFTLNQAGAVAITTTGAPTSKITETGTLPAGLTFTDNGNGTALLSGTGTAAGTANLTITASNGINPDANQAFTVVVGNAPAFTSASTATATVGSAFSFTATAGGYPAPSWGDSNLPPGVSLTDNKDGTATLSGTPTTPGTYAIPLSAVNAYGTASQTLTITVQQAPAITSGRVGDLHRGHARHVLGDDHRQPDGEDHRVRGTAFRRHADRRRQRDGHPGRYAGGGQQGQLPDHDHRDQRGQPRRDAELHDHRERGFHRAGDHQRRGGDLRGRLAGDVHGDDYGRPDGGAIRHQQPGPAVRGHVQGQRQRHRDAGRNAAGGQPGHLHGDPHRQERDGDGHPGLHPDRQQRAGHHQRGHGHGDLGQGVQLHGDHHGHPGPGPDPHRDAPAGHHLQRQHQRDGYLVRHAHGGRHGPVPADLHRQERHWHRQPGVHADGQQPAGLHQRGGRHRDGGHRVHLHRGHDRLSGGGAQGRDAPGRGELLRQRQRDRIAVRYDRGRGRYLLRAGHRDQQRRHRQPGDHPDRQGGRHGAGADVHQRGRGDRGNGQGVLLHGHHGGQPDQLHHQRDPQRGLAGRGQLQQQRQRDGHADRDPDGGQRRDLPGHVDGGEHGRDDYPVVCPDRDRRPGDHLGGHRHGHRRLRLLLHGRRDRGTRPGPGRGRRAAAGSDLG